MTQDLSLTSADVGALIQNLCSRQPAEREEAELAIKDLTPGQVDQLVQILRAEPKKTMGRMALWWSIVAWPMVFLPSWLTFGQGGGMSPAARCVLFGSFLAAYMVLFPLLVAKPRFQGALFRCVTQVNEVQLLGPLITYSTYTPDRVHGAARIRSKLSGDRLVTMEDIDRSLLTILKKIKTEEDVDLTGKRARGFNTTPFVKKSGSSN